MVLYNNVGGVSIGIQSLRWDWIVSTNCAGLSGNGNTACVCDCRLSRVARLLHHDLKIGVDCALATYRGVEPGVTITSMLPVSSGSKGLGMPDAQGSAKLLGRIMGSCPELRSEENA